MKLTYVVSFSGQHLRVFVLCLAKDALPVFSQLIEKENVFNNSLAKAIQKKKPRRKRGQKNANTVHRLIAAPHCCPAGTAGVLCFCTDARMHGLWQSQPVQVIQSS